MNRGVFILLVGLAGIACDDSRSPITGGDSGDASGILDMSSEGTEMGIPDLGALDADVDAGVGEDASPSDAGVTPWDGVAPQAVCERRMLHVSGGLRGFTLDQFFSGSPRSMPGQVLTNTESAYFAAMYPIGFVENRTEMADVFLALESRGSSNWLCARNQVDKAGSSWTGTMFPVRELPSCEDAPSIAGSIEICADSAGGQACRGTVVRLSSQIEGLTVNTSEAIVIHGVGTSSRFDSLALTGEAFIEPSALVWINVDDQRHLVCAESARRDGNSLILEDLRLVGACPSGSLLEDTNLAYCTARSI